MRGAKEATPVGVSSELVWREEWVDESLILKLDALQVRRKVDAAVVRRYNAMTQAGRLPPPIKLGKVGNLYYLVDGWHRMAADALVRSDDFDGRTIKALVADLDAAGVRWESAKANMDHGVPLKPAEYRRVLGAFIKARRHRGPGGTLMSYRDLGAVVGKGHTTVRNWIIEDFPRVALHKSATNLLV